MVLMVRLVLLVLIIVLVLLVLLVLVLLVLLGSEVLWVGSYFRHQPRHVLTGPSWARSTNASWVSGPISSSKRTALP